MGVPLRGEVWLANFDPVEGHEQSGKRPAIIFSVDAFNATKSRLVVIIPFTKKDRNNPLHVQVQPPVGGLDVTSFALTEMVRSVSQTRLIKKLGVLSEGAMNEVADKVKLLLGLC